MILGFAIALVLHPTNGVLIETCDYSDKLLSLKAEM
jgi:hypothetical protein